jgi:hypothetical protein
MKLDAGVVLKWNGTHFEAAELQEQERFIHGGHLPPNFDNMDGWSRRNGPSDGNLTIEIGGIPITIGFNSGYPDREASIDLIQSTRPQERIWSLDHRARHVSQAEYEQILIN